MRCRPYTKEWLEDLCKDSYSYSEVLRKAGRKQGGGNQKTLKNKIEEFNIDISHFTGAAWSKGKTSETDERLAKASKEKEKYSLEEIFIENSPVSQKIMRDYVKKYNLIEYKCDCCGNDGNWQNGVICLEIDHKNGINNDNRLENLHYLCPNCHALTETYRGKNKKEKLDKGIVSEEDFILALKNNSSIRQALLSLGLSPSGANYTRANQLTQKYGIQKQ